MATTYGGKEFSGLHRCAGVFQDGQFIRHVIYSGGAFRVLNTYDVEVAAIPWNPDPEREVALRSIGCIRSAQSGNLVIVAAGLYAGGSGQRAWTVATDYAIKEPVVYRQGG